MKDKNETLLDILLSATDWMHACGGKGRCTTCKVQIVEGTTHLSTPTAAEEKYRLLKKSSPHERLACQTYLTGDLQVLAPEEYRLPHLNYTD